ncbi:MAG: bifunctional adenosylcobinamide kinase/adenosylcobinamide-phosphate guanylyltransferase [Desulfobacterium sp.]|nr:bifunctional adenosylcobinamide kinase/adenosylcobinamide-phosphate guanylyltransferase [Desulfobacterium sp.]MBU3950260.1 bifunctional adenosylcobinamide kinase/adenosylcobinamide-phosphate guanylyltransferase [Pseudomonadota bacterium]MBU4011679.1 bifunctional adenosylcobinamide kinase/adenosylcobinamide-phosphate guanylyltransferase [Pseudomonadota bacterium]
MKEITLITGGCKSGKSRHALELADNVKGDRKLFVATCIPFDDEMKERIRRHQEERSKTWHTLEVPVLLSETISEWSAKSDIILIDCLTLWINNIMFQHPDIDKVTDNIQNLVSSIKNSCCPVVLVSNEVGSGIVPDNELARFFRDAAGLVNQKIASISDKVIWMVAGIPVVIKETTKCK